MVFGIPAWMSEPKTVGDILDRLAELAEKGDRVAAGDIVESFGSRSYGPFLLVPALVVLSPLGAIPALPSVMGVVVILFAVQIAFGRQHMWLPGFLKKREVEAKKLKSAVDKLRPVARFLDRWFHGRAEALTKGIFVRLAALASIVLAATVPPLELLPFASAAPMAAIALFGLALVVRDGLLMVLALLAAAGAFALGLGALG